MTEQDTLQTQTDNGSAGLGGLKIAQLQTLASQLGITGTSRMRKAQLVEIIADHQRGGSPTAAQAVEEAKAAAAKERKSRGNTAKAKDAEQPAEQVSPQEAAADSQDKQQSSQDNQDKQGKQGKDNASQNRNQQSRENTSSRHNGPDDKTSSRDQQQQSRDDKQLQQDTSRDDQQQSKQHDDDDSGDNQRGRGQRTRNQQRRDQGRNRKDQHEKRDQQQDNSDDSDDENREGNRRHRDDDQRRQRQRDRNRSRDRRRDNDQDHDDQHDVSEDDSLLPVSGILDVLDNYAFVRTSGYLPGPNDVYVSMAMVKRFGLRKGDAIRGRVRAPQDEDDNQQHQHNQGGGGRGARGGRGGRNRRGGSGGGGGNRQKFNALVNLELINGEEPVENPKRVEFNKLTPLYPQERLRLESNHNPKDMGPRLVDLVAPIGKGQRGLIVSPPKAGKTLMLQSIANAITTNNPEVKLMMVLVDERPEEVTDMQRSVRGEVIASTFDRPAEDHTTVAELSIERAKRMVELGHDVVVLLDSMTRLGRAYNLATPASGRILSGGVDSAALYPPKKFFGAARNIEGGGSLTILATALVETGSRMDEVIFEEFKGTGNMELRLSRELSERRIFPAIDINASGTRREENLLTSDEIRIMWRLRRVLSELKTQQALELLTSKLKETETNAEFLMLVSKTTLRAQTES